MAAAGHRRVSVHVDDDLEDRTPAGRGRLMARAVPVDTFLRTVETTHPARVPGTAVFDGAGQGTPPALAHNLRYNRFCTSTS
jgi:K+ transporter